MPSRSKTTKATTFKRLAFFYLITNNLIEGQDKMESDKPAPSVEDNSAEDEGKQSEPNSLMEVHTTCSNEATVSVCEREREPLPPTEFTGTTASDSAVITTEEHSNDIALEDVKVRYGWPQVLHLAV
jgi:hypothetical protein